MKRNTNTEVVIGLLPIGTTFKMNKNSKTTWTVIEAKKETSPNYTWNHYGNRSRYVEIVSDNGRHIPNSFLQEIPINLVTSPIELFEITKCISLRHRHTADTKAQTI